MFNRILEILAWTHRQGVVHGAVLPPHVLVHPVTHGAVLVDWCYATPNWRPNGPHLAALSAPYRDWYPPEVFDREPATPALDLYLAATTLVAVAGGDPVDGTLPDEIPGPVAELLRGCRRPDPDARHDDAFEVYDRLRGALQDAYGAPSYHPFHMPPR
jgi:serine/threonine protein kinase